VLLRPIPSVRTLSTPDLGLRSSSSSTTRKRKSLLQVEAEPIIGFNVPVPQREPIGQPGSAAAEPPARRTLAIPAVPAQASAATTPREQPATSSLASAVQAAAASATQTTAPPAREAAPPAQAPAPASSAPSGLDLEGMLLQKVLPVYPTRARREGLQGQVVLKAVIGKDGNIAQLLPVQGPQELTQAAIDAVQHWRFRPYQLNGKPVEVETDIRLNFQLPKK
jgi:protein TonB